MATQPGPVNLSVVTQDELSRSVQKLAVAAPFHRLKSGFVERFLRRREPHFDHFQINVIDPDTIFQARLYNEKPRVTFEQEEIAEVQEYISQGFWAWSGDPAVSPSGGDAEKLSDSSAQQVSSAETVPTSSAGLVATALMGDGVATNQAGGDGGTGLSKDSQVLMNFLTKLDANLMLNLLTLMLKSTAGFWLWNRNFLMIWAWQSSKSNLACTGRQYRWYLICDLA